MDALGRPGGAGPMISAPASSFRETPNALTDFVPDPRKRKIEEVDGHQQDVRVRLGMQFHHDGGSSISPSSYRTYSDFPRSSYPSQMPTPATTRPGGRPGSMDEADASTLVRTAVTVQTLDHLMDHTAVLSGGRAGEEELDGHAHRPIRGRGTLCVSLRLVATNW